VRTSGYGGWWWGRDRHRLSVGEDLGKALVLGHVHADDVPLLRVLGDDPERASLTSAADEQGQ